MQPLAAFAALGAGCGDKPDDRDASVNGALVDARASNDADSGDAMGPASDAGSTDLAPLTDSAVTADGSPAAPLDAAQPDCRQRGYALCEDFEDTEVGAMPAAWNRLGGRDDDSAPRVVSTEHRSGNRALETATGTSGQVRASRSLAALGALRGKHWGRIWYKSDGPLPAPTADVLHNTIVALEGTTESRVVDTVVQRNGFHQFLYNVPDDSVGIGTDYRYRSYDGLWHCAEWYVDANNQSYRFFFDGTEASFVQGTDQRPKLEQFGAIALGFISYLPAVSEYRGWLDDLAISTERVGCQ